MIDHFAAEFKEKTKIDVFAKPRSLLRMRVAVEKVLYDRYRAFAF
jgi:molecular chaperone DnaK (HSP70)